MKNNILVFIIAVSVVSAIIYFSGTGQVETTGDVEVNESDISYHLDSRTKLCFAITSAKQLSKEPAKGIAITEVPCSDEVMELIEE